MRTKNLPAIAAGLFLFGGTVCAQPQPVTPLWSYPAPAVITTSPTLATDGTIYIGTGIGLCAITNAGSNRWTFPVAMASGGAAIGSPAVSPDGTIYFGGGDATFYALNSDGSQKWKYPLQPEFQYKIIYAS